MTAPLPRRLCLFAALLILPLLPLRAAYDLPALEMVETQVSTVVEKAMPCVVALSRPENLGTSQGSGCIIAPNGLILTAAHVVGDARIMTVTLPDQKKVQAKVLGADYGRDVALAIITDPRDFPFLELGDTQDLAVGDMVVALGHSGGFDPRRPPPVRFGRVFENPPEGFIRTDCTMVGGDSGGPLLDLKGKVIGVHSSVGVDLSRNNHAPAGAVRLDWDRMIKGERWGHLREPVVKRLPEKELKGLDVNKLRELLARESMANKGQVTLKPEEIARRLIECGMNEAAVKAMSESDLASFMQKALGNAAKVASNADKPPLGEAFAGLNEAKLRALLIDEAKKHNGRIDVNLDAMKKMLRDSGVAEEASNKITPDDIGTVIKRLLGPGAGPEKPNEVINQQDQEIFISLKPGIDLVTPSMVSLSDGTKPLAVGTIVRENGFILTKHSDIAKAKDLKVELADGRSFPAVVVHQFEEHDLALVKIQADQLPTVSIPNHESGLHLGSYLVSPGTAPDKPILGQGVLSVLERNLRESGGYLGIGLDEADGVVTAGAVVAGGPAAKAGLQKNDQILAIGGTPFHTAQALSEHIRTLSPDSVVQLKYKRGTEEKTVEVSVGDRAKMQVALAARRQQNPLQMLGTDVSERKSGFALVFQHDQPLRPQDCGGIILDLHGNIVGVNIARVGRVATYAIPARVVCELLDQTDFTQLEAKAAEKPGAPAGL